MRSIWVALLASVCGAALANAAGQVPERLPQPSNIPQAAESTPVAAPAPAGVGEDHSAPCASCRQRSGRGRQFLAFFTYSPSRVSGCQCRCCGARTPPPFAYFLNNCVEGCGPHGCGHDADCASCNSGHRFFPMLGGLGFGLGSGSGCASCGWR
jgi:hypothetical protein